MLGDCASIAMFITIDSRSDPTSSRCQISRMPHQTTRLEMRLRMTFSCERVKAHLVEPDGIEPTTSCLQSRRSPNWTMARPDLRDEHTAFGKSLHADAGT